MIIQSYNDILREIEGLELRIGDIETSIKYYQRLLNKDAPKEMSGMHYSDMPTGNGNAMTLDRIYCAIGKLESHLYLTEEALKCKTQSKKSIEEVLSSMEGLEYKVFYMNKIEGKKLPEVAKALAYSYDYIREVSASIKQPTENPLTP